MKALPLFLSACAALAFVPAASAQEIAPPKATTAPALWVRYRASHTSDEDTDKALKLAQRAAAAGYNGLLIVDGKFARWNEVKPATIANMKKVREACRKAGIEYIPGCIAVGYANDLLSNDPNLAEGVPVVDAPFDVKGGKLVPEQTLELTNGDFASHRDNKPVGWEADDVGKACFIDTEITYKGKPSVRIEEPKKNTSSGRVRVWQTLKVKPWQYYHMSVAIKTEKYDGKDVRLMAMGTTALHEGHRLNVPYANSKADQDWTVVHQTFNSQEFEKVTIYLGDWAGNKGKLWFADAQLEAAGLVDCVRREGAPLKVTSLDGKIVYEEGKDVPPMIDPLLGKSPYSGGYHWHAQPTLAIPQGSRLKDGDKVLVSYHHTMIMCYGDQCVICMAEPKTDELIAWQVAQIKKHLEPDAYFMMHDEIRIAGWDASCTKTGKTPGQLLADHIKRCTDTIHKADAGKRIYVWSDMFDKYHNAGHEGFYEVVKGASPWMGAWEGLDKEVGLLNWNAEEPKSLKWFADRGHSQVISGKSPATLTKCLDSGKDLPRIEGACYVTWDDDYTQLEAFAVATRKWFAAAGRK